MSDNVKKGEPYPVINTLECKACERCVLACKKGVLHMSDDINQRGYHYVFYEGEGCTGCGDCYYTCPEPLAIEVHIPRKKEISPEENNKEEIKLKDSQVKEDQEED